MVAERHGRCLENSELWGHSVALACLLSTHKREWDEGASTGLFKQGSRKSGWWSCTWLACCLALWVLLPHPISILGMRRERQ